MEVRDFSRVFESLPEWLNAQKVNALESEFLQGGAFGWESGQRRGSFAQFVSKITEMDFGLNEGQVVKYQSPTGFRLIFIGTFFGNVVLHQRPHTHLRTKVEQGDPSSCIVSCYAPRLARPLLNDKPLTVNDLYRYTGYFNKQDNVGYALKSIRLEALKQAR